MVQCAFRLEESLVERLDAYAKEMGQKQPGLVFTRADAVRVLLTKSLADRGLTPAEEALMAGFPPEKGRQAKKRRKT